ncbi:hypothetical protein D1872_307460 [compost metagenome]
MQKPFLFQFVDHIGNVPALQQKLCTYLLNGLGPLHVQYLKHAVRGGIETMHFACGYRMFIHAFERFGQGAVQMKRTFGSDFL